MKQILASMTLAATLVCVLSGCALYRMPTEDDLDIKPGTNNSTITNDSGTPLLPGMGSKK